MTHSRLGLLVVLAAVALVTSTAGFSTASADRAVQVAVVDDDAAYLGIAERSSGTANGTTNLTVAVTNRFPTGTSLETVRVSAGGQTTALASGDPLDPGETRSATFENVACDSTFAVNASGSDVAVHLDRVVECV